MFDFTCSSLKNHAQYNQGEHGSGGGPCDINDINATCIWSNWTASASSTGNTTNNSSSNKSGVASLYYVGPSSVLCTLMSVTVLSTIVLLFA
jgi:hypothetical protein